MTGQAIASGVLIGLLGSAVAGLVWLLRRAHANRPAPLRPESLREMFDRKARGRRAGERAGIWMMRLGPAVPGVLLAVLAERASVRIMGAALVAWFTLPAVLGLWFRRSGRFEAAQQRAIARSEAFWSQPDAEDRAREMRRGPFRPGA